MSSSEKMSRRGFLKLITRFSLPIGLGLTSEVLSQMVPPNINGPLQLSFGTLVDMAGETGITQESIWATLLRHDSEIYIQDHVGIFAAMESFGDPRYEAWLLQVLEKLFKENKTPVIALGTGRMPFGAHPFSNTEASILVVQQHAENVAKFFRKMKMLYGNKHVELRLYYEMNEPSFPYGTEGINRQEHEEGFKRSWKIFHQTLSRYSVRKNVSLIFSVYADKDFSRFDIPDSNGECWIDKYGIDVYTPAKNEADYFIFLLLKYIWPLSLIDSPEVINKRRIDELISIAGSKPKEASEIGGFKEFPLRSHWMRNTLLYMIGSGFTSFSVFDVDKSNAETIDRGDYSIDAALTEMLADLFQSISSKKNPTSSAKTIVDRPYYEKDGILRIS